MPTTQRAQAQLTAEFLAALDDLASGVFTDISAPQHLIDGQIREAAPLLVVVADLLLADRHLAHTLAQAYATTLTHHYERAGGFDARRLD